MRTALALIDGRLCTSLRYALRPGWRPRRPAAAPSSGFPVQARAGTCASGPDATFLFGSSSSSVDRCAQGSMARPITNKALSRSPSRSLSLSLGPEPNPEPHPEPHPDQVPPFVSCCTHESPGPARRRRRRLGSRALTLTLTLTLTPTTDPTTDPDPDLDPESDPSPSPSPNMNPNPNPKSGMALAPLLQSDFEVPLALLVGASAVGDGSCHTRQVPVGAWAVPVVTPDGCAERPFWVACCR